MDATGSRRDSPSDCPNGNRQTGGTDRNAEGVNALIEIAADFPVGGIYQGIDRRHILDLAASGCKTYGHPAGSERYAAKKCAAADRLPQYGTAGNFCVALHGILPHQVRLNSFMDVCGYNRIKRMNTQPLQ